MTRTRESTYAEIVCQYPAGTWSSSCNNLFLPDAFVLLNRKMSFNLHFNPQYQFKSIICDAPKQILCHTEFTFK